MEIKSTDLLYSIFQHIQGDKSIDFVQSLFLKYDNLLTEKQKVIEDNILFYNEKYKSKRDLQNYQYEEFLKQKQILLSQFKENPSKENIYKIIESKFHYSIIDDIFSYDLLHNHNLDYVEKPINKVLSHKKNRKNLKESKEKPIKPKEEIIEEPKEEFIEEPKEELKEEPNEKIIEEPKEELKEEPNEKIIEEPKEELIEEPKEEHFDTKKNNVFNTETIDHSKNVDFWKKNKTIKFYSFYHHEFPYDNQDADAVLNSLLTSASLNVFLYNSIKDTKMLQKIVVLNAEFYFDLEKMINNEEDMDNLIEGYLKFLDKDWNNKVLFIPINIDNIHWISCIIDPKKEKMFILDPYGHENPDVADNINTWRNWLLSKQPYLSNKAFEIVYDIPNIAQQNLEDVDNCGVYTISYFMFYMKYDKFPNKNDIEDIQSIRKYIYNYITKIVKCPIGKKLNPKTNRCVKEK